MDDAQEKKAFLYCPNLFQSLVRFTMSDPFTVIDDSPLALKKETTQLKRLLKTSNMSLESLRISNQSVRERCRQLEANLEKEKAANKSLNMKLHEAAATRCEMDSNIQRAEYQIDKLSQRNIQLQKEVTRLTQQNDAQAIVITKHEEQAEIWETAFEQHKVQKLELIDQIVKLEGKLQSKEKLAKRSAAIKAKVNRLFTLAKNTIKNKLATLVQSTRVRQTLHQYLNVIKSNTERLKNEFRLKHASKKREMSKVKRNKYWERSQIN